jgi:YkoY family integral membrane protein
LELDLFHQTFQPRDLFLVLVLVILEALLSIDNAIVLGLLAQKLPGRSQKKALTYGLVGSFIFRMIAVAAAAWLLKWRIVKMLGGAYLVYVAIKHFVFHDAANDRATKVDPNEDLSFWSVVASIELTDMAFATDSILAGIALVGPAPLNAGIHPKLWVILVGGMIGVMLMRVAAIGFINLLKRFPRFATSAYLLVSLVGMKLLADWWFNADHEVLNFESPTAPAFWGFWSLMLLCGSLGFLPGKPPVSIQSSVS